MPGGEMLKVLFLTANPERSTKLGLNEELRKIKDAIRGYKRGSRFKMVPEPEVRASDLPRLLRDERPDIVHFSGHGMKSGSIVLFDNDGSPQSVPPEALADLFRVLKDKVRVVFFNACYSEAQALAVVKFVDCSIGISDKIGTGIAPEFSAEFYGSLASGQSVKDAFDLGMFRARLMDPSGSANAGNLIVLHTRKGVNPTEISFFGAIKPLSASPSPPSPRPEPGAGGRPTKLFGDVEVKGPSGDAAPESGESQGIDPEGQPSTAAGTPSLDASIELMMQSIPSGIYHLLDPQIDPLLVVTLRNKTQEFRRVRTTAAIIGVTIRAVKTIVLSPDQEVKIRLLPPLMLGRARELNKVQRAALYVEVIDLDGTYDFRSTYDVVLLSRNSSFNAVHRPGSMEWVDLTHYYGAWVTPYDERVRQVIRRAAELSPGGKLVGYQGGPDAVTPQVEALYKALQGVGIIYVNSILDFGAAPGQFTQWTRLPRESITSRTANVVESTVLFASLLEGSSISGALAFVPGHVFVGWETWHSSDVWRFLETTMIGSHSFEQACSVGQRQYDLAREHATKKLVFHKLNDLRARGIWPM